MISAKRIDHANDDVSVVNAARVSMDKWVDKFIMSDDAIGVGVRKRHGMGSDEGLVNYLAKNRHWTPFAHQRFRFAVWPDCGPALLSYLGDEQRSAGFQLEWDEECRWWEAEHSLFGWFRSPPPLEKADLRKIQDYLVRKCPVSAQALGHPGEQFCVTTSPGESRIIPTLSQTFLVEIPIYVARQLMRSNVGIVYNEVSRRYVDGPPEFHRIGAENWRGRADNVKQGSGAELPWESQAMLSNMADVTHADTASRYDFLLRQGAAPELARSVLPQSLMTKIWMTATDSALARVIGLREDKHAQKEIRDLADCLKAERIER